MAIPDDLQTIVRASISPVEVWGLMEQKPNRLVVVLDASDSSCSFATRATVTLLNAGFDARQMTGRIAGWDLLNLPLNG